MADGLFRYTTKSGTRWGVSLKFKGPDLIWREKTWRGFEKKADAAAFRDLRREERTKQKHFPGSAPLYTVHSYFDQWLKAYVLHQCKRSTAINYQCNLNNYVIPALGSRRLDSLKPQDMKNLLAQLQAKGLAKQTIRNIFTPIREAFDQAVSEGILPSNPTIAIKTHLRQIRDAKHHVHPLTPKQTTALLNAAKKKDAVLYVGILLGVRAGLRRGEILGLEWNAIDWTHRQATIKQARVYSQMTTTKSHQLRTVDLTQSVIDALKKIKQDPEQPLILHRLGRRISPEWLLRTFQGILVDLGLPKIRFHDLRHTYASQLIAIGASPKYIQTQLGHSSINVTFDCYGHLFKNERTVDRLEKPA